MSLKVKERLVALGTFSLCSAFAVSYLLGRFLLQNDQVLLPSVVSAVVVTLIVVYPYLRGTSGRRMEKGTASRTLGLTMLSLTLVFFVAYALGLMVLEGDEMITHYSVAVALAVAAVVFYRTSSGER